MINVNTWIISANHNFLMSNYKLLNMSILSHRFLILPISLQLLPFALQIFNLHYIHFSKVSFCKKNKKTQDSSRVTLGAYTQKTNLIESKKMICLKDFLWFKKMICSNEIKFVWFKQNIFEPNKYLFEWN